MNTGDLMLPALNIDFKAVYSVSHFSIIVEMTSSFHQSLFSFHLNPIWRLNLVFLGEIFFSPAVDKFIVKIQLVSKPMKQKRFLSSVLDCVVSLSFFSFSLAYLFLFVCVTVVSFQ